MGRNSKIFIIISTLTVMYGSYYWGIPVVVNLPKRVDFIEQKIQKELGYKIEIKKPDLKMGIIPSLWVNAESLTIFNDDKSKAFEIISPKINIKLFPLIFKTLEINHISAQNIYANFSYDSNLKLGQYTIKSAKSLPFDFKLRYANIENFNISFDDKLESKKINLTAKTNAQNIQKVQAEIILKNQNKVTINSHVNTIKNGVHIEDLKISGKDIDAFAQGEITHLNANIPHINMKIGLNKSRVENLLELLPNIEGLSPDIDIPLLKQTGFWGDATANLEIKGKADYPHVYGNVLISNAYMVKEIPNAEKATIKLGFKGDKFNLDVKVPTSPTQTVWVKGPINLDKERSAELDITSTENVDLKTAQTVLNPLHKILYFDIGPVPIMDIKGNGGINLHVVGTRKNPYGWGQFHFNNTTASFLDIKNMVLNNGSGTLDFDNQNTVFQTKTALLNGQPISVKGTCSLLGVLDFDVLAKNQDLNKILYTVKTSPMLSDIQKLINPIEKTSGRADLKLKLTGQVKDVNDIVFNKNLFAKGSIKLLSNTIKLKNAPASISKISGIINFDNLDADFNLLSNVNKSQININGNVRDDNGNIQISSNKFNLGDGIKTLNLSLPYTEDLSTINVAFDAKYNGKTDIIEPDKINIKGKIFSNNGSKSSIIVNNSYFELNKGSFKLPSLKGVFENSPYNITLNGSNIFSNNRILNGFGKIENFDLNTIKNFQKYLPTEINKNLNDIEFLNGKINLSTRIYNNNFNVFTKLDDINILYKPKNLNLAISSGNALLKNNTINLNKINTKLGEMPIFVDGKISNINKNPNLNIYINAKPTQKFFDQFFNNKSVYPIKLKGDAIVTSKIYGSLNNLNAKSTFDIAENSSLYYMGATIGDIENPVKITIDETYSPNEIKVNSFQYDKIISSLNNKPFINTQLNASGAIKFLNNNNVEFNNFKIKTQTPTDAKIFNIIFRKPFMKQGVFSSNLILNGNASEPKILGKLYITSIDIPFFDSTIQEMDFDFKPNTINLKSKGTVLTNNIHLEALIKNKLTPPYIVDDLQLNLTNLNINKITDTIRDIEAENVKNTNSIQTQPNQQNTVFDLSQLIVNSARIKADKIKVRNIDAENFVASLKFDNNKHILIPDFKFDIAEGAVLGSVQHNIPNFKTDIDIHLNNANALIMSEALFDLKGQVYGSVNGDFNLSCTSTSQENCFKTLAGMGTFKIANGKMPKLGSLEYLLKAGNLFKGGLTGLSINSIIDLITPLKTGEFESISGDIHLTEGIADVINIYSSGNDLDMYMTGSYNIVTSVADMEIFGSLSKNITTVFGKIKNASLNTLFNTIPGINNSNEKLLMQKGIEKIPNIKDVTDIYRIFAVDVNGDINGENYVKSFKWVK